jgi:hypothetical protein
MDPHWIKEHIHSVCDDVFAALETNLPSPSDMEVASESDDVTEEELESASEGSEYGSGAVSTDVPLQQGPDGKYVNSVTVSPDSCCHSNQISFP